MKRKFFIWTGISILFVVIFAIAEHWSIRNGFGYFIGSLIVPFFASFVAPILISSIIIGIYHLINKKRPLSGIFSKSMWISQSIMIFICLFSLWGQSKLNVKSPGAAANQTIEAKKTISNKYIELRIPENWNFTNRDLVGDQLYNILCYSDEGTIVFSSIKNTLGISAQEYYFSQKETLFSNIKNNMQNFKIIDETEFTFLGQQAFKVNYKATYQGVDVTGESICFSKCNQMILISSASNSLDIKPIFNAVYKTIDIKE